MESERLFLSVSQHPKSGVGHLVLRFLDHTQLDSHAPGRTPMKEGSALRRGRYVHDTQQTQDFNISALNGIQTRDPSNQATADPRLRPHGQQDRRLNSLINVVFGNDDDSGFKDTIPCV